MRARSCGRCDRIRASSRRSGSSWSSSGSKLRVETERATEELASARKELTELLRMLQANEDFIDELVQIRQAQKALEVIHRLTQDIREANDQLKKLIGGIKPPGA